MSISSTNNRNDYTGNSAVNVYGYAYRIIEEGDITVTIRDLSDVETTLVIATDYTVSGVGEDAGGNVTLVDSGQAWLTLGKLTTGFKITIRRIVDLIQNTDIRNRGDFFPEVHEDTFDYLTMIAQQQQDDIDRAVKLPETISSAIFNSELPADITTPNQVVAVNAAGNAIEMKTADDLMSLAGALTIVNNLSDLASVPTSLVNLGIDPLSQPVNYAFTDAQGAAPASGLTFDGTAKNIIKFNYGINEGAGTLMAEGEFRAFYDGANWALVQGSYDTNAGLPHHLTFGFTEGGPGNKDLQITVATSSGSGNGNVKIKSHSYLSA